MPLELEDEDADVYCLVCLVFVDEHKKTSFHQSFCTHVMICSLICRYDHYLRDQLLFATALFCSVCQQPLIQELWFSSYLTVIAMWKLSQQNWISTSVTTRVDGLVWLQFLSSSSIQEFRLVCIYGWIWHLCERQVAW